MSLVYAAVVPHAPLVVPAIAKERADLLSETRSAMEAIGRELYAAKPDVVWILTPHGAQSPAAFVLHVDQRLVGDLREFGDFTTVVNQPGALGESHHLKSIAERHEIPVVMQSDGALDYGCVVPWAVMNPNLDNTPLLPIRLGAQNRDMILRFAHAMTEAAQGSNARMAIFASADLSRRETATTHGPVRPTAEERAMTAALTAGDISRLAGLTIATETCGYAPILALATAVQPMASTRTVIRSFQAPFGVGHMTAVFNL